MKSGLTHVLISKVKELLLDVYLGSQFLQRQLFTISKNYLALFRYGPDQSKAWRGVGVGRENFLQQGSRKRKIRTILSLQILMKAKDLFQDCILEH